MTAATSSPTRYDRWMKRLVRGQLDFWAENWRNLSGSLQYADWQEFARSRGLGVADQYHMTRGLLTEVLYAAGGLEREVAKLGAALAEVQRAADVVPNCPTAGSPQAQPGKSHITTPAMREASYAFVNVLSWSRAVRERVDRRYKPGISERAGLLPALAPGPLRNAVEKALITLDDALAEARLLTNYAIHAGAVPGGGSPSAEILSDGRILARIPDPVTGRVLAWDEFEFTQDRDMLTYSRDLMTAIESFVETVLTAFEINRPQRAGALPSP